MKQKSASNHILDGRRLIIPRMSTIGASAIAAAFKSIGVHAEVAPKSDDLTFTRAARFTTGEECLPQRITLGNFLKIMDEPDFDPNKTAFLMPTSSGPCRFGQYAPLTKKVLRELAYEKAIVFSPTSSNGYAGIADNVNRFKRWSWRAVVVSDALRKMQYMFRPYEANPGEADAIAEKGLEILCEILGNGNLSLKDHLVKLREALEEIRDHYQQMSLSAPLGSKPLIGLVGEIFVRLNSYSNQNIVRKIEKLGGEVWIADVSEWVWYTNSEIRRKLREKGRQFSLDMFKTRLAETIQARDEADLLRPLHTLFKNRPETRVDDLLAYSAPYLPQKKALGEMTVNAGKAIAFYHAGADGVIDICPFTCMNGIVSEAVYPVLSRDYNNLPVRVIYVDGVPIDLESHLQIFMELAKSYRNKRLNTTS